MSMALAIVQIVGAPVACAEGVKDSWRDVAIWVEDQLSHRYGSAVEVKYFDLFDPTCPPLPSNTQLPVVLVNDQVVSMGGKISIPKIREHLEVLKIQPVDS